MLTNKIFNASALRSLLNWIYAFYQIFLCLLANVILLTIKFCFACYQIYSHLVINTNRNIAPFFCKQHISQAVSSLKQTNFTPYYKTQKL